MTKRTPDKDELRKTGLQEEISTDAETESEKIFDEREASSVLTSREDVREAERKRAKQQYDDYHIFRKEENRISLIIFTLSGFAVISIMVAFIINLFIYPIDFIGEVIGSSGNGAGYLLAAVVIPSFWIAAGNFRHRRGDGKAATLADKVMKSLSDES